MQRSTKIEQTFITTHVGTAQGGSRGSRTVAGLVAVALVGSSPWMAAWSNMTLAQDAPTPPAAEPAEPAPAETPAEEAPAETPAAETPAEQPPAEQPERNPLREQPAP